MKLNKSLRIKIVLAVSYWLVWFPSDDVFIARALWGCCPSRFENWMALLVPLALLFSTDIWCWIKAGGDD